MTEPELIDQLARRLRSIGHHCGYCANSDAPPDEYWLMMAREVVRQMEFVRDQCCDCIGGAAEDSHERAWEMELTPAPPDWQPMARPKKRSKLPRPDEKIRNWGEGWKS